MDQSQPGSNNAATLSLWTVTAISVGVGHLSRKAIHPAILKMGSCVYRGGSPGPRRLASRISTALRGTFLPLDRKPICALDLQDMRLKSSDAAIQL
jgi:hypothetical protein